MQDCPGDKVNILIVDDKPDKVLALEALVEDLGQNIVRAYSGREALRCILAHDIAVILLDVNMPGMDGFETATLIRQRASTQHVPIIFVTAYGDETYSARGYSLGAVDFIQTPVVPDVLRSKVAVFVDLAHKSDQVRRQAESLRRRAAQLQKLAAAALAINRTMPMDGLLQTISDSARDIIGCDQAITLFLNDPYSGRRTGGTQAVGSFAEKHKSWRDRRLALAPIADTLIAQSRTATRLPLSELHEHPDWEVLRRLEIPPLAGGMLAAPLSGRDGNNLGMIYLTDRNEGQFTDDDEAVLVQLAQMASIAIENTLFADERQANRIKDEFLSTLSHELRTPLNAILGWSQLLRMQPDDLQHGLEIIERNARAQAKLIEDLLDVSRINSGKLRLNCRPLHLGQIVDAAVEATTPLATDKGLSLIWRGSSCDDAMSGDPDRLQQVVWNLLSNAIKFTPAGGHVEIQLDSVSGNLRLQVIDSGQGIKPSFLSSVFDRFRQADSSSTRAHGGLGLGLTIVRRIVELHGGMVHAESPGEGRGATFTVMLPPASPEPSQQSARPTETPAREQRPGFDPASLHGIQVLVVDDDPDAVEVLTHTLQRAGAVVSGCSSVCDAMEAIKLRPPDLIISDIAMPGEDGFDLVRTIRQSPSQRQIPVIALTAYAGEDDRARSLAAGFDRHLSKPIDPLDLIAAVTSIFATPRTAAHTVSPNPGEESESPAARRAVAQPSASLSPTMPLRSS